METKRKNILFILPDQMRADFLGCYGAAFAKTPFLDDLASKGICYEHCISPSPICVPARASLLTGMNAIENGVINNDVWLRPDHEECGLKSWPKLLSQHGYDTIAVGKMHFYPWDEKEGFTHRVICEDKRHYLVQDDYDDYLKANGLHKYRGIACPGYQTNGGAYPNPHPKGMQPDDWISDRACDYLRAYKGEKPFAMMVGFLSPHDPYDPDKSYADLLSDADIPEALGETEDSKKFREWLIGAYKLPWCGMDYSDFTAEQKKIVRKCYAALIYHIDLCVGKILNTLKETGHSEDTVIIFSSDHGDFVGDYSLVGKCLAYEPSAHVPLLVYDPDNKTKGKRVSQLVSLTDIRATILHYAGFEETETDNSYLLPYCGGLENQEREIFCSTDTSIGVCYKHWKLARYNNGVVTLFNLLEDPTEQNNLAYDPKHVQLLKDMDSKLQIALFKSLKLANAEKSVNTTLNPRPGEYFNRQWKRPYPVDASKEFYGK
jgi:arylsulfatase A-like enzyme